MILSVEYGNGTAYRTDIGDVCEKFSEVYFIIKTALDHEIFTINTDDGRIIGSDNHIPYSSKIKDFVDTSGSIIIKLEPAQYPYQESFIGLRINSYLEIIDKIKDSQDLMREMSDRNMILIREMIPDISPMNRLIGQVVVENGMDILRNFSETYTLTGTRIINTISMSEFRDLPEEIFLSTSFEGDPVCIVCQCDYEEGDEIKILPCGHKFHTDCVEKWLTSEKNECPLCRAKVCNNEEEVRVEIEEVVPASVLFDD